MKHKKYDKLDDEIINKIISVAYNDATIMERIQVFRIIASNDEAKQLLKSYREIAKEVHEIEEDEFPEELLKKGKLAYLPTEKIKSYFLNDLIYILFAKPLAVASVGIVLIAFIITAIIQNRSVEYNYSEAELRLADKQAKYALALVGKIFNDTKITVSKEILQDKVGKPIQESFGIVNKLFNEKGDVQ